MLTTWILVANRSGARLFEHDGVKRQTKLLRHVPFPEGRRMGREIDTDRQGRAFQSGINQSSAMSRENDSRAEAADRFARELAEMLHLGRTQNQFDKLVLVAEPGFLGEIKLALDKPILALLDKTIDKDLAYLDDRECVQHLARFVPTMGPPRAAAR